MCPRVVVVVDDGNASNRGNHPLGIRVLPWRARRDNHFANVQDLGLTRKPFTIDLISVPEEVPRRCFRAACLEQLPRRPFRLVAMLKPGGMRVARRNQTEMATPLKTRLKQGLDEARI